MKKYLNILQFHDNMRALVTHAPEAPIPHTLRIIPQVRAVSFELILLMSVLIIILATSYLA